MRTALVTGAGGFLGRYITEQLIQRGVAVRAFSRRRYAELHDLGVASYLGDIRDRDTIAGACAGCDTVFHTAAIAGIWGRWQDYYATNTLGTQHVIDACRQQGVSRLVYSSSPSVTFDGRPQYGVNESAPYARHWLCHYPRSKALAEQAVLAANGESLATCALRPHLIWGPRDAHLIPRLLQRARAGQLRQIGDGSNLIDMVYVENAAHAHLAAADALSAGSAAAGRPYFISQGEPVNCWQWINQILRLAGLPSVRRRVSLAFAWRIGAMLEGMHRVLRLTTEPRMTRFLAAQLGTSHFFDITAARRDFDYQPLISTDEGMRRLAKSWVSG